MIPTIFAPLIQNGILLLAGWQTFKVLETTRNDDDTHWLTFWFVYTLFAFAKSIVDYSLHHSLYNGSLASSCTSRGATVRRTSTRPF